MAFNHHLYYYSEFISILSVIVIAGACGLVGTPIALLALNSKIAKNDIIVKGGIKMENKQKARTIVFDNTGTLTIGKTTVKQIISFNKSIEPKKILQYAAIAEYNVNHEKSDSITFK